MKDYDHIKIEKKWREKWDKARINHKDLNSLPNPFYNLMMFPYPSAEGLHIGSVYTFSGVDTFGRYNQMKGQQTFEPIGLDGFGIHSENYAIKIGEHIRDVSKRTEKHFYEQLDATGNMFDWQRTVETYKPDYYKWTQWLFTELFKSGLAYRKNSEVSWCPSCKTVLSDEQVENGECERCGSKVVQKELNQWFFKITDYTERLLENLDWIKWDKDVKIGQKNWIGKKIGINIDYKVNGADETITCFTTRPDTNFGATFIVLAPEHPFVDKILNKKIQVNKEVYSNIKEYVENAKAKTELDRISEGRNKTGVFTSFKAVNILNGKEISIWISDFVLGHFGTGAVVGVPGHDKRDFEFASKFDIEIIRVVVGPDGDESEITTIEQVQESEGYMINSEFLNKMHIMDAKERIMDYLEEKGFGNRVINYNLRDWCVSRQRYWGPPIPMIFSQEDAQKGAGYFDGEMPGWWPEDELPVLLPEIERFEDILPDGSGKGPLEKQSDFVNTISKSGRKFQRETDVSDPFVDSSWYFLRYPFVGNDNEPFEFVKRSNLGEKVDLDSTFIEEFKKVYSSISKKSIRPIVAGDIALFALNGEAFKNIKEIEFGFVTKQELDFAAKIIEELGYKPSGEYFKNGDFTIRMSSKGYEDMYLGYRLDFQGEKIRIADPRFLKSNFKEGIESEIIEFWLSQTINKLFPVHHYIGGKEHTVLHLLYARFITMVLNDLGYIDFEEPFENFYGHGLITKDGSKMSKSKGNVINPDEYFEKYGADAVRMYLRFLGPFDQGGDWRDTGMNGMKKFVNKIWEIYQKFALQHIAYGDGAVNISKLNQTVKGVGHDLESMKFNTAVAKLMELINWFKDNEGSFDKEQVTLILKDLCLMIAPMMPHIAEELWSIIMLEENPLWKWSTDNSIHNQKWPSYDDSNLDSDQIEIAVQINGKTKGQVVISKGATEEEVIGMAKKHPRLINQSIDNPKRVIFIKDKIINFVI